VTGRAHPGFGPLAALLLLALTALPAPALTLVYLEGSGGDATRHTIVVDPAPGGLVVAVTIERAGRPLVREELETDAGFSVRKWRWVEESASTDVTAVRDGATISLTGRREGRAIDRTFDVGDDPWYQLFPLGLERLALDGTGSTRFWAIGTSGIAALRAGHLRAVAAGSEGVAWGGGTVPTVRVRVSLPGPGSLLWHGDYWYSPANGRFVVAVSDRGPGTRSQRMELVGAR
jgi:hypothetical protein